MDGISISARGANGNGLLRASVDSILRNQEPNGALVASPRLPPVPLLLAARRLVRRLSRSTAPASTQRPSRYHAGSAGDRAASPSVIDDAIARHRARRRPGPRAHAAGALRARRLGRRRRLAELPDRRLRHLAVGARASTSARPERDEVPEELARGGRASRALPRRLRALTRASTSGRSTATRVHTSTLACVYGGLMAAAAHARDATS